MTADTDYISQLYQTAVLAARARQLSRAEAILQQILELDARHLKSLDLMGYVQYFLQRPTESKRYCELALQLCPNHAYALKGLGLSLAACGQVDEGVGQLKKAIAAEPAYFDPYWDLAVTLARAGRIDDAMALIDEAAVLFPAHQQQLLSLKSKIRSAP